MEKFEGKVVCEGMTYGPIYVLVKDNYKVIRTRVGDPEKEVERVHMAKAKAIAEIEQLYNKALVNAGEESANIFEVHRMMLLDEDYMEAIESIVRTEKVNAEYAVVTVREQFAEMFRNMDDDYMKERALDVIDISNRLVGCLYGREFSDGDIDVPSIVVADDLAPSDTIKLDKTKVLAFVTRKGTSNSHTAILARAMNIPALTGVTFDINNLKSGLEAVVDADNGYFILEPKDEHKEIVAKVIEDERVKREKLLKYKGLENITKSGKKVELYANVGSIEDIMHALENDAGGIGLFRSEFLFIGRDNLPNEEEQYEIYTRAISELKGKKLVIRTLDIGADKRADYLNIEPEENPALGLRAIRLCLKKPKLFRTQLRALYRAATQGPVSIMFPMVTSVEELMQVKQCCLEAMESLERDRLDYGDVEMGIMIETPAAAMISDELAKKVDFFSIGTNDLTQYTLAIDRQNIILDDFYNAHHKAVLRMIKMVVDNAHKEGIWVGICGELASDTMLTQNFINMGVDELSVAPNSVLDVRRAIRKSE